MNASRDECVAAARDLGEIHPRWPDALRRLITARIPMQEAPSAPTARRGAHGP